MKVQTGKSAPWAIVPAAHRANVNIVEDQAAQFVSKRYIVHPIVHVHTIEFVLELSTTCEFDT